MIAEKQRGGCAHRLQTEPLTEASEEIWGKLRDSQEQQPVSQTLGLDTSYSWILFLFLFPLEAGLPVVQAGLQLTIQLGLILNSWFSCLHLLGPGTRGMIHHAQLWAKQLYLFVFFWREVLCRQALALMPRTEGCRSILLMNIMKWY